MYRNFVLLALAGLISVAPAFAGDDSLFADMGGKPGIDRLVDLSVDNYLGDERIKAIFDESLRPQSASAAPAAFESSKPGMS